ncbi:netrin receptor dcc [Plakobranchus ocellatus]|uniref:Netrin receptor dcc n=1 Tax=Plakobranchus ocellatus TaxID=259542 RepID=A0AAV4C4B7_9GAST|nr:netrin receptor dcc [Plakobranchus ocellatus]
MIILSLYGGAATNDVSTQPVFRFIQEPKMSTLTVPGGAATLDCLVHYSGRRPDVYWTREGGKGQPGLRLVDRSTIYKMSNGSLHFTKVTGPDTGYYRCAATVKDVGTIVSRRAKLEITYLRKPLQKEPSDLALALGDIAAFQCIVDARPLPMVTWYKGNTRVVQGQGQGVTIYPTVTGPDTGYYRCAATVKDVGTIVSRRAKLEITCECSSVVCPLKFWWSYSLRASQTF